MGSRGDNMPYWVTVPDSCACVSMCIFLPVRFGLHIYTFQTTCLASI